MAASWADRQIGDGVAEVVIGITNPDPGSWREHPQSSHRHRPEANPFTYWERHRMIRSVLTSELPDHDVVIVPFPLDRPDAWFDYIPPDANQFVRAFTPWERSKAGALSEGGYDVTLLEGDPHSVLRASVIRSRWHDLDSVRGDLPDGIVSEIAQALRSRPGKGAQAVCETRR